MHKMAASTKNPQAQISDVDVDWAIVLPRRGKQKRRNLPKTISSEQQAWGPVDDGEDHPDKVLTLLNGMQICIRKLENSDFYHTFLEQIQTPQVFDCISRALASESKMQMVIYGIGSIESHQSSRFQLSLAVLLKRKFDWIGDIEVFDPIISITESQVLRALNCNVLLVNEQGRRQALKPTLFFMPHYEAVLYDNLLLANWRAENLNRMILLGNSFEAYQQYVSQFKNSTISEASKHLLIVRRFATEVKIAKVSDEFFAAFHDSSWHFFNVNPEMDLAL